MEENRKFNTQGGDVKLAPKSTGLLSIFNLFFRKPRERVKNFENVRHMPHIPQKIQVVSILILLSCKIAGQIEQKETSCFWKVNFFDVFFYMGFPIYFANFTPVTFEAAKI